MLQWDRRQGRMGDDPPFLTVGTEVSAKYKGAFCEAKVRKVVRSVKCKVTFKLGLGTISITDDQIRGGTLRVGSVCEVKHPEKKEFVEATINKIQDCSQYTVVFDDGDITTLRRTALCLKSGRHFAESETLDQLPLTHPEHFGNPVIGGRKGRRSRQAQEESSDEEETPKKGKKKEEKEADIGKVVCVELGDKKKQKDNWFPGLVVAPTAQDTVRIRVKDEYLVRSFKDGRYFTVPKKEATEFTREIGNKVDNHTLKAAVEKALQYLDRDELPPHWDRDLLFGLDESSGNSDSDGALDSDSSDDEPREEKDHFVAQLYKFMDDRGTPINRGPTIGSRDVDLYKLFKVVHKLGGYNRVTNHNQWKTISQKLGFGQGNSSTTNLVKQSYKKFLHSFEDFYRKLGCTMVNHPRGHRSRHRTGRSLIRDRDRATPTNIAKDKKEKEEKSLPAPEKASSSESTEKEASEKKEEEKPREEEKKEEVKQKEASKKSKIREDKSDIQSKQKGKDAGESSQAENEEKDIRPRGKKDSKTVETKVPRLFEDLEKEETDTAPEELPEPEPELIEETKSRDSKSKARDSKLKERTKTSEKSKSKEEKTKVMEEDKGEDAKKKIEKKPSIEDDEKHTRGKAKEDSKIKKEAGSFRESQRENRTPVRDCSKIPVRMRKEDENVSSSLKKRGRKRKEIDEKGKGEESMGRLASHVAVSVGDKLKVYYGPTHESKVTYEAKVLDIEEDGSECMYLVHYTGWNTRYDEWIKRGRIADNLSWTPSRAKRQRQQQSQHKISRPIHGKRGRPSISGRSQEGTPNPPRSTTPSSVTSSSSRTKSPATRTTPRSVRSGDGASPGHEFRRRTRRMSGHTDISVASDSESEEFESEAEPENEMAQTRSRTTEQRRSASANTSVNTSSTSISIPEKEEHFSPCLVPKEETTRRSVGSRKKMSAGNKKKESVVSTARMQTPPEDDEDEKLVIELSEARPSAEKRRSRRGKRSPAVSSSPSQRPKLSLDLKAEVKTETSGGTESEEEAQPKGRDFDLNQIRSELKGIEKAVKSPHDLTPPPPLPGDVADDEDEDDEEETKIEVKQLEPLLKMKGVSPVPALFADIEDEEEVELRIKSKDLISDVPVTLTPTASTTISMIDVEEDVYEFKEPEPFEFEVRKRESLLPDLKMLGRKPGLTACRLFELPISEPSPLPLHASSININPGSSTSMRQSETKSRKRFIRTPPKDTSGMESNKKLRRIPQKKLLSEVLKTSSDSKEESSTSDASPPRTTLSIPVCASPSISSYSPTRGGISSDATYEKLCSSEMSSHSSPPATSSAILQTVKPSFASHTLVVQSPIPASGADESPVSPPLLSLPDDEDDDGQKSPELGPLSIFSQGQDDDGDDDHEDRLVISESDDMVTEIAEPLFSYQQRDHEDIFPTLVTSTAVAATSDTVDSCKSEDPPCLSPVVGPSSIFRGFSSPLQEAADITLGVNLGSSSCSSSSNIIVSHGGLPLPHLPQQHKLQPPQPLQLPQTQTQQPPQLQQQKQVPQQLHQQSLEYSQLSKEKLDTQANKQEESKSCKAQLELLQEQLPKQLLEHDLNLKEKLVEMHSSESVCGQLKLTNQLLELSSHPKKPTEQVHLTKQLQESPQTSKQQTELMPKQDDFLLVKPSQEHESKLQQDLKQITKHPEQPQKQDQSIVSKPPQDETQQQNRLHEETPLANSQQEHQHASQSSPPLTSAAQSTVSSSPANLHMLPSSPIEHRGGEDVIKELLKQRDDEYEEDSINAAIQRALDGSIMEEEGEDTSGDIELFCEKQTLTPSEVSDPLPSSAVVPTPCQKSSPTSSTSPRHSGGANSPMRKRVTRISLESTFLDSEDSAADSSDDEGQRLIIDPMEDEGSSQAQSCSSPLSATELRISIAEGDTDTRPADLEDDVDIEAAVDDEIHTEDEETVEEASEVLPHNTSSPPVPDELSSGSEVVTAAPIVSEEDTMEAEELPSINHAEEQEELEDEESLGDASCSQLNSEDMSIDVSDRRETAPVMTPVIVKVDLDDANKMSEAEILSGGVVVLDASASDLGTSHSDDQTLNSICHTPATTVVTATIVASSPNIINPQSPATNIICDEEPSSDTSPILALAAVPLGESEAAEMRQELRSDDADSQLLGSLLCQETIPGSPAQAGDSIIDETLPESKVVVLEMPFASVPASSCDTTGSTMSLPVPISMPLVTSTEAVTTAATTTSTTMTVVPPEELPTMVVSTSNIALPAEDVTVTPSAGPAQHHIAIPSPGVSKLNSSEAAPVMENTPPTTPDSTLSTMSGSPREEHGDMSPAMDNESSKSHRDSFEMDLDSCPEATKVGHFSEDDSLLNVEVSNSCESRIQGLKLNPKKCVLDLDKDNETSPKKRRRSRKRSESESNKRMRCSSGRSSARPTGGTGSDSDDTSENSALGCTPMASSESTLSSKSPRPSKYNFYVELAPELDGTQRIALLQQKLQELRKTYMNVKAELACIDRRRKKLRRREREGDKSTKQEVACS